MAVERHVLLSRPQSDGTCLYDHFEQVVKVTGKWPEGYEPIPPPDEATGIWEIFWELRRTTQIGMGVNRISFLDMDAWQRVRGVRLGNISVDLILQMDAAYIAETNRDNARKKAGDTKKPGNNGRRR